MTRPVATVFCALVAVAVACAQRSEQPSTAGSAAAPRVAPPRPPVAPPVASPVAPPVESPGAPQAAPPVASIHGGSRHVCAIRDDRRVECWGYGRDGQIGDGALVDRTTPALVPGLEDVTDVGLGEKSTCALRRDGTVTCWGANDRGQLGDGTTTSRPTPGAVPDLANVQRLAVGNEHVCVVLADRTVRCWGHNEDGQLGDGTTVDRTRPVQVAGLRDVEQLALGAAHSCARTGGGAVRCWGTNAMAQLGVARRSFRQPSRTPIAVTGISGAIDLVAGLNHTCVRTPSSVACWGWNEECQVGFKDHTELCISRTPCKAMPTPLPALTDVAELALNAMHSCVRHTDGTVTCWGDDPAGFLPNNTVDSKVPRLCEPTRVAAIQGATRLTTYGGGVCVLLPARTIACWGSNWFGELGDGTTRAHAAPAPVKR